MFDIIKITAEINTCPKIVEIEESKISLNDSQSTVGDWLQRHWRRRRIIKIRMERNEMNKYKGWEEVGDKKLWALSLFLSVECAHIRMEVFKEVKTGS
jgi:hypothetical protein